MNLVNKKKYIVLFSAILIAVGVFGILNFVSPTASNHEYFLLDSDNSFAFKDINKGGFLVSNRKEKKEGEKFRVTTEGDSQISFKNYAYANIFVDENNFLRFSNSENEKKEIFNRIYVSPNQFILQSSSGLYVSKDTNDFLALRASVPLDAEKFEFVKEKEKGSYFTTNQIVILSIGFLFLLTSIILFQLTSRFKTSIVFLVLGGLFLRVFISILDSHLALWDEQFHALVAKNMLENPFKPMLYKEQIINFGSSIWTNSHIWLHKQPLFLWQIALSIKLFGVNAFAVRLPSIIMSSIGIGLIYRVGKITINRNVGFYGGILFAVSFFCLELVAGKMATDHNDIAFFFYISVSIWAWMEYMKATNKKRKLLFIFIIGLSSGAAVLVKWLVGLVVYSGWGMSILFNKQARKKLNSYIPILKSFIITLFVFLPWQFYIFWKFPLESQYEYSLNTKHFFNVIEGHGGDYLFHIDGVMDIYSIPFLLFFLVVVLFFKRIKEVQFRIALATYFILIYLFFTLAATKMIAFTFCISLLGFVALGSLLDIFLKTIVVNKEILKHKYYSSLFKILILAGVIAYFFNYEQIQKNHTMWLKDETSEYFKRVKNQNIITDLDEAIPDSKNTVVFNCREREYVQVMFFNDFIAAYPGIPTKEQCEKIKQRNLKLIVFDNYKLPEYIIKDKEILILDLDYWKE